MASNILNVLENVEKGRQNCIKNAKLANLPATDDMDIFNIGNLFLEQNNTEFINPNNPEVGGGWQRPNDWWDTETILKNAQDIEQDGVTYHPTYIMLFPNTDVSTIMSKTASDNASQGDAFIFSDEPDTLYVGNQTHTWDVSKDKPCSLGYKTRYIIVFTSTEKLTEAPDLYYFKCIEFFADTINRSFYYWKKFFGSAHGQGSDAVNMIPNNSSYGFDGNAYIENVQINNFVGSYTYPIFENSLQYCANLRRVSFPNITTIDGSNTLTNNPVLVEIDLDNITYATRGILSSCPKLNRIKLSKLQTINCTDFLRNIQSLKTISLPYVTTINSASGGNGHVFGNCENLTSFTLDNLEDIETSSVFEDVRNVKYISLPNLKNFRSGYANSLFNRNYSLEKIDLPQIPRITERMFADCCRLKEFEIPYTCTSIDKASDRRSAFTGCVSLTNLILFENFNLDNLNCTDCPLTHDCIIDMFNKLKDLTGENSLTLTIGANNLAKVTDEEKLIANNKNWILA